MAHELMDTWAHGRSYVSTWHTDTWHRETWHMAQGRMAQLREHTAQLVHGTMAHVILVHGTSNLGCSVAL